MGSRGLGQLAYNKAMMVLAASQADDVALESGSLAQGLLTYALVREGLDTGLIDQDGDGEIDPVVPEVSQKAQCIAQHLEELHRAPSAPSPLVPQAAGGNNTP